tara:strand:- start:98 stop:1021 length:924 start_codon:yes stop_codon:yes gene_type:complete
MADKKVYRYPYTLIAETTDYLQIDVVDYKPIGKNIVGSPGSRRNQTKGKDKKKTILLPIPSNISDTNAARYGSSELNSIAGAAIGGIKDIMESGAKFKEGAGAGFGAALQAAADTAQSVAGAAGGLAGAQGFITRQLAASAAGMLGANITPSQLLARTQGEILNPNMELLFNGPTLRSFKFSFKMTPRNTEEAGEIKQIINCFKQSMAPKVGSNTAEINEAGGTNTFLRTPNVFELRYRQGKDEHQFLNKFKQCFLESISVNYTADGAYATYDDGTPVSMVMDLSFKEIEPVYDVDYTEESYRGVGY